MPKRVLDFDALWASDKIASCPAWAQAEYAWLYGLADASGSFELTNLRVIWGRVAAVRKDLSLERLEAIFHEFIARGLLFTWEAGGKRYGHWTGSDVPGRLPPPSWRARLEKLAPPVPKRELAAYTARFSSRREPLLRDELGDLDILKAGLPPDLKAGLEPPQAQDWDQDWKEEVGVEHTQVRAAPSLESQSANLKTRSELEFATNDSAPSDAGKVRPEDLVQAYENERGANLPPVAGLTPERHRLCAQRIRAGLTVEEFAMAVRRAAVTPFLCGEGARGWRASFDWLIANDTNVRKVSEGGYDQSPSYQAENGGYPPRGSMRPSERAAYAEINVGKAPVAAEFGVRVRPEVLERIRARAAARGSG
jgi:hypothetical protein